MLASQEGLCSEELITSLSYVILGTLYKGKILKLVRFKDFLAVSLSIRVVWYTAAGHSSLESYLGVSFESLSCIFYLTNQLTNIWSSVLREKLIDSQPVKKFPAFCGLQRIITLFTIAHHLSLS